MRAYLAIIRDSFHEAVASRVLWILLGGITLVLGLLSPVSLPNEPASRIQRSEMMNGSELILKMKTVLLKKETSSSQGYLVSKLSEKNRHRIEKIDEVEGAMSYFYLISGIRNEWNDLLKDKDFHDEKYWKTSALSDETKKLIEIKKEERTKPQTARLNRILIEETFPKNLKKAEMNAIYIAYFGQKIGETFPFPPTYIDTLVNFTILVLMQFLGGILGISVGIMVTSPIIPNMYEPGSIDLLLSKPVSRSLLFLSRFIGACSFMLLVLAYLIIGIWLIAGVQFDVWNSNLLLCIPVFLFLFMIFYSVSALAGVIWRNPIVCVVMTLVFWGACFTLGMTKLLFEGSLLPKPVTSVLTIDEETLITLNNKKEAFEWKDSENHWEKVFHEPESWANTFSLLSPQYDSENQRLVTVRIPRSRYKLLGGFGNIMIGQRKNDWKLTQGLETPSNTFHFFQSPDGKLQTVSLSGVYRFEGDITQEKKSFKILGFDLAPKSGSQSFKKISPEINWKQPVSVANHPVTEELFVYEEGRTHHLVLNSEKLYEIKNSHELRKEVKKDGRTEQRILTAFGNGIGLIAFQNGEIQIIKMDDLSLLQTYKPLQVSDKPRKIVVSPDGHWIALCTHNRDVWLYDVQSQKPVDASWLDQKDIVTCNFSPNGNLLLVDLFGNVSEYQPGTGELIKYRDPPAEATEILYAGLVRPLYTIFPSPGELDRLVAYLLLDQEDASKMQGRSEREDAHSDFTKIWEPVWSCMGFLVVMLAGTCVYVSRKDF